MSTSDAANTPQTEKHEFQAEVSRLLHMMVHSVYSEKEVFLRELISNASDACDRLRHLALTQPDLTAGDGEFRVAVSLDKGARTLTISDNGTGMNHDDAVENLGTIARSGTAAFIESLSGDARKDTSLIGQFGVGFYSAFMVADKVTVLTRRAGEDTAWAWESDGLGSYTITPAEKAGRGTDVILHIREEDGEYLDAARLKHIIQTYSDHIAFPITLHEAGKEGEDERVNQGSALWARPKAEITDEQYTEFYHHVGHAFDDPWHRLHFKAEGVIEYTGLLFIPSMQPFDLFDPMRKPSVKLYVRRVFITDDCEDILPGYLRFLKGVIDSEDLPLNISREMLQNNPVVARIRQAVTKRVLSDLEKEARDAARYAGFWKTFGAVLKEGIYEDAGNRDTLLKLARFRTSRGDELVSLDDYVARMGEGQSAIYYLTADDLEAAKRSPQLEGFTARGIEVLLLTDPVDNFWLQAVGDYAGKPLKSVTRGAADLAETPDAETDEKDDSAKGGMDALIAGIKLALGDAVKDVRLSKRLTDSPVCLVAEEGDLDINLQKILKAHNRAGDIPRVLEINPGHKLVKRLAALAAKDGAADALRDPAHLLLDQARIFEGEPLPDPKAFITRMAAVMERGLEE